MLLLSPNRFSLKFLCTSFFSVFCFISLYPIILISFALYYNFHFSSLVFFLSPYLILFSPSFLCDCSSVCVCVGVEESSYAGWGRRWERKKKKRERDRNTQRGKQSIYWNKTCCFKLIDKGRLLASSYFRAVYALFLQSILFYLFIMHFFSNIMNTLDNQDIIFWHFLLNWITLELLDLPSVQCP